MEEQVNPMSRHILVEVGEMLFGYSWQPPLATALGVSRRTMVRWVAGTTPVPHHVIARLPGVVRAEAADKRTSADHLDAFAAQFTESLAA